MSTVTLDDFRKITNSLEGSLDMVIRQYDCVAEEWVDAPVVLAGLQDRDGGGPPVRNVILLAEHTL
jgi:hypothetical protein